MSELEHFVSKADVDALHRPTAEALGLPGSVYTDPDFWELERRDYFASRFPA